MQCAWKIETFYRDLKHVLKAEKWHTRTLHGFYVELVSIMVLATLTRLAMVDAAAGRCPPGSLSFGKSFMWVRSALRVSATVPADQWSRLYAKLLEEIGKSRIDWRPDRHYERDRQKRRTQSRAKRAATLAGASS